MSCKICNENSGYYPLCKNCYSEKEKIKELIEMDNELKTVEDLVDTYFIYKKQAKQRKKQENNQEFIKKTILNLIALNEVCIQSDENYLKDKIDIDINILKTYINFSTENKSTKNNKNPIEEKFSFFKNITQNLVNDKTIDEDTNKINQLLEFRKKNQPKILCEDGHKVRSRAEKIIDDFFSLRDIKHYYETKVPIDDIMYCDFYLPQNNLYIEFWGMTSTDYLINKERKTKLYKKYKINYLDIEDEHIDCLIDVLPEMIKQKNK